MSNNPKQLLNCLKRAETRQVIINFNGVLYHVRVYTVIVSYRRSTNKVIFWLVTVYYKMYPVNAI